jgi:hypothetical protein
MKSTTGGSLRFMYLVDFCRKFKGVRNQILRIEKVVVFQDYIKEYGKPMTKKVYHRCIICGAAFLQVPMFQRFFVTDAPGK